MTDVQSARVLASGATPLTESEARGIDPDARLVAEARRDRERFVGLYERYFERVHRYIRMRVRDRAASEDVTSEVFVTALANLDHFRGTGSFSAWLFRIAQNSVRDHQRNLGVQEGEGVLADLVDPAVDPERQVLRRAALRELLDGLSSEQQDLVGLRYGAGLRCVEIGEVLGKSPGAVRVELHRILNHLRRRYDRER
ncbi:MAG TPA: sigma-70 family RNA polymerase sigma factor [Gaiellaceae bacterium]|jgi:RNA polymerase sigma-70 factor (ECF subfamily)